MARTKGSGWGNGGATYYVCPACKRKKAVYIKIDIWAYLKCTWRKCKEWTEI